MADTTPDKPKDPLEEFRKLIDEGRLKFHGLDSHMQRSLRGTCPSCGYCEHCGRGGNPYRERNLPGGWNEMRRAGKVWC